ncbi:MAG: Asp-tRNA(Asn)/Glu-tRNA(Gln) amidotransferase subunit GatC [Desulfovibrionaceae bacterium]|nr:Asp-tRNA(Asn)/Glu-tRNA(Gln) amidotransferase subunit GatC [Desulfovibrionaceae bacterium]
MPLSKETILHISRLAKLDLAAGRQGAEAEAEIAGFTGQMNLLVEYLDILKQADTDGVEPLYSPMSRTAPPAPDEPDKNYATAADALARREQMLKNAPEQAHGFFVVPKIL